jgi:hypothetical protein
MTKAGYMRSFDSAEIPSRLVVAAIAVLMVFAFKLALVTYTFSVNSVTSVFILGTEEEEERSGHNPEMLDFFKPDARKVLSLTAECVLLKLIVRIDFQTQGGFGRILIPPPEFGI